jgi:hypothetical protein
MRVHANQVTDELHPGIFIERGKAVSVDWERYSTAAQARDRGREPEHTGVVALCAGDVRKISGMHVFHEPLPGNRAHSGIHGMLGDADLTTEQRKIRKTDVRNQLFDLLDGRWELRPRSLPPKT